MTKFEYDVEEALGADALRKCLNERELSGWHKQEVMSWMSGGRVVFTIVFRRENALANARETAEKIAKLAIEGGSSGITLREMTRRSAIFRDMWPEARAAVIDILESDFNVAHHHLKPGRGRPTSVYIHSSFTRQ